VGAVIDIVVWLRSLGLGKYEAAFRENDERDAKRSRHLANSHLALNNSVQVHMLARVRGGYALPSIARHIGSVNVVNLV
jgi:hypothetical protein